MYISANDHVNHQISPYAVLILKTDCLIGVGCITNSCRLSICSVAPTTCTSLTGRTGNLNGGFLKNNSLMRLRTDPESARIYTSTVCTNADTLDNLRRGVSFEFYV